MKLADLKRLSVGTKLLIIHNLMGPVEPEKQLRTVKEVRSNALIMAREGGDPRGSWLRFPKAENFRDDGDGFTVLDDHYKNPGEKVIAAQYKFVEANKT